MNEKFHLNNIKYNNSRIQTCLLRVDFNVPISENYKILDDTRIRVVKKTIDYLIDHNIRIIMVSHMGRPKGKKSSRLSLNNIKEQIEQILKYQINIIDFSETNMLNKINSIKNNELIMLDNIRFFKEEENYSESFSETLSSIADIYVNEAFAVSHRNHSSITGVTNYLPSYMGYKMYEEYNSISNVNSSHFKNSLAIFGGSKIDDKILILHNFIGKVNTILIGGGMIQSFLKSKDDTNSKDRENDTIVEILNNNKTEIVLPDDVLIKVNDRVENIDINKLSEKDLIVDIGFRTINKYKDIISNSDYILWNGPMGIFEIDLTNKGTAAIAKAIEMNQNAYTVAGGGSTLQAIKEFTNRDKFSHVSTGGGAFMEYIENGTLPGIEAIIHNSLN